MYRYVYDKKIITFDRVHEFLEKYTTHKLQPTFKNEQIKEAMTGKVHNLNQQTFTEVMDLTKPGETPQYLVMFYYDDKCEKCKPFQKVFEQAAQESPSKSFIFGRINMSKNEVVEVMHLKTPHVHLTTGYDDPHVRIYKGDYTLANFSAWIEMAHDDHVSLMHGDLEVPTDHEDL